MPCSAHKPESATDRAIREADNPGVQGRGRLSLRPMQVERHELRCFHAVIEAGGFSRAAERLDLSQSAVSQTIANLEHRLGTSLLRRGNPPQPTEAGIRLLRFAETMLNEER